MELYYLENKHPLESFLSATLDPVLHCAYSTTDCMLFVGGTDVDVSLVFAFLVLACIW